MELKLQQVQQQLREAGSDRKEAHREKKMSEGVAELKRLYPNSVSLIVVM